MKFRVNSKNIVANSIKNLLIITLPTLLIFFAFSEIFFRLVIPANNPPLNEYNKKYQFLQYSTSKASGQYTIGRFSEIRTKWTINKNGFNYPIDFETLSGRDSIPLIAIIGDSYIEAFQVHSDKSYPFLLRNKMYPDFEVYGLGISGAPISHYFHLNKYVNIHFDPEIVVFQLIHNDFVQSFKHKSHNSIWWQIEKDDTSYTFVPPSLLDFVPTTSLFKKIFYKSATFRYLHRNLFVFERLRGNYKGYEDKIEANTKIIDIKRQTEIRDGIDFIFSKIKQENKDKKVIFIIDAPRNNIYQDSLEMSKVKWMHEMVKALSLKYNFGYIDLTESMKQDYTKFGKRFNSNIDGHWNEYGHNFVANVLYQHLLKYEL